MAPNKPSVSDEERSRQEQHRSRQEQQRRPNHMRRPSVLPDLNLLSLPPQQPTLRPDENALIPTDDLPDSKASSDEEVVDGEEDGDDGDADDENEETISQLAQIYINRGLAILTNWIEELQHEILLIREELQILQKLMGPNPK